MTDVKQILRDIKLSEVLGMELNPLTKKVKEFIDDKLCGLVKFEMYEYPDSIFYKKDKIILFEQDLKNEWLRCSYEHYWSFFRDETSLNYNEIQELTKYIVGEHLNCKEFTPENAIRKYKGAVGTHLNCKQFTPRWRYT